MALKYYRKCVRLDRKDGRAQNNIGNVYKKLGRHKKALEYYEESNKYDAEHPAGWYNVGNACDDLGHLKKAIKNYEKSIKLAKGNKDMLFRSWFNMGRVFSSLGQ